LVEGGFCDGFWEIGPVGEVNYLKDVYNHIKGIGGPGFDKY